VCREELRKFRALLFQIEKDGPEGKKWREGSLFNSIEGFANFVAMVNPDKGAPLRKKVAELRNKHSSARVAPQASGLRQFRADAAAGKTPRENWWQAQPRSAPVLELTAAQILERKKQEEVARQPPPELKSTRQEQRRPESASREPVQGSWQRQPERRPSEPMPWWGWVIILWAVGSLLRMMFG
jgi:hypothetical protein